MKSLWIHKSLYIIILFIYGVFDQISSIPAISLYNTNDKITVLTNENFHSTVYNSKTIWIAEFYASWCGHCQFYANTYREIAVDTWSWSSIVRFSAFNCYGGEKDLICRQHNIRGYPTILLIPPNVQFDNSTKPIIIPTVDIDKFQTELIKQLENLRHTNPMLSRLIPVNRVTFEDLYARSPSTVKLVLVIVEKRTDLTGRQVILDFSKYDREISIFRTTTDGRFWRKFHSNTSDVPALFIILRNRTAQRIPVEGNLTEKINYRELFNEAIRFYIHQNNLIEDFDDQMWNEIKLRKETLREIAKKREIERKERKPPQQLEDVYRKVSMIDLELALFHIFRREIPLMTVIHNESYDALIQWINVLIKYFPGREPVMNYLRQILSQVRERPDGISGDEFLIMSALNTSTTYLPNHRGQYQFCSGSSPQHRGYPCSLWVLFHVLTISQIQQKSLSVNVTEIPFAIQNYIKHYFACRHCSDNFLKETKDIDQLNRTNLYEALIYFWKVHNSVNRRLHGDVTEDHEHPKIQFPDRNFCSTCRLENSTEFDQTNLIKFLLQFYSAENLDTSMKYYKTVNSSQLLNRNDFKISIDSINNRSVPYH